MSGMRSSIREERAKILNELSGLNRGHGHTENRTLTTSYHITLFRDGYETEFFVNAPLFINRNASLSTKNDVICAVSIPQLNMYLEKAVRMGGKKRSLNGREAINYEDQFYVKTPEEFAKTYSFIGALDEKPELAQSYSQGGVIKPALNPKIGVRSTGVVTMKQLFSSKQVAPADQLYFVTKPMTSPYNCFYNTKGQSIGEKTSPDKTFLQVIGFSSRDTVIPAPSTAENDLDPPRLSDTLGIAKNIALKGTYKIMEYDEETDRIIERPAEDLDVPELLVDMTQEGEVIKLGHVQTCDKKTVSEDERLKAHRNYIKQMLLPNVNVVLA